MEHGLRNGAALLVREAEKTDAAAIIDYMNRVGGESDNLTFGAGECQYTVEMEEAFIENTTRHATSAMLLGVVDGEIISIANLMGVARARLMHTAGLAISVRRDHWRLGIAEIMLRSLIAFARGAGIRVINLDVRTDNLGAIRLYEKLGFAPVGIHRGGMRIGDEYVDLLAMDLHLAE